MAHRLFTSESVTEGHPDKVCDQISDAVLDDILAADPNAHVACETFTTTGMVTVMGEITTNHYTDIPSIVRRTVQRIGYTDPAYGFDYRSCAVMTAIDEQSPDIAMGVNKSFEVQEGGTDEADLIGAGDQGMMFGYAVDETAEYLPLTLDMSHKLVKELAEIRRAGREMTYYRKGKKVSYLRPDSKSQVTIEYGPDRKPVHIDTIVISTQHDEFLQPADDTAEARNSTDRAILDTIAKDVREVLIPRVLEQYPESVRAMYDKNTKIYVNPTGKFVIGGPHGDTGLTGRKIIVDTYGGRGFHGGGAFSGKDPSKVDRSAAYAARHIAKNLVAAGVAGEVTVQVSYAIGRAHPINLYVNTHGTAKVPMTDPEIAVKVNELFDMRPRAIEERLGLRNPIYRVTAAYGHMGRTPETVVFNSAIARDNVSKTVDLFTWERLDMVQALREAFGLTNLA